jgi:tRNA pseudouridine(55) synthase
MKNSRIVGLIHNYHLFIKMLVYKPIGKTVAQMANELKAQNPGRRVCYSGRLDPMAHGFVYFLFDDEVVKRHEYDKHDKVYQFQVIIGINTDTTDVLGLVNSDETVLPNVDKVVDTFTNAVGTYEQEYHIYSSMCIKRKPLWYYAINNMLDTIVIPKKEITVYEMKLISQRVISDTHLKIDILGRLAKLIEYGHTEFRTKEIVDMWTNYKFNRNYTILTFEAKVSFGTYIRQIVKDVGLEIGISLMVLEIERPTLFMPTM